MRPRVPFRCLSAPAARALLGSVGPLVLDARDASAFAAGRLDGALHLSRGTLADLIAQTPRRRPILIYCYHGHASREYAQIFSDFGFLEVYSLDGGYEGWGNSG
ncbi:thiosulfate sulfurtransferase GlpE [Aquabacter spiritensis]|uniref:Rhodanese-related sulfurtransferase n=1 Tax=Aquabacter spiritensis TaxID=933073 RepID=A0A4R3M3P5_9HYPH|nr:thiosulfate sulfurtransferase GlpE [Aquabacter spiritensis]TCT07884.1 rhodanese-related sulfurtransferase [Aquabacter spiritensis]